MDFYFRTSVSSDKVVFLKATFFINNRTKNDRWDAEKKAQLKNSITNLLKPRIFPLQNNFVKNYLNN